MLSFIKRFIRKHRYPPTIREMQEGLGMSSSSVAYYHLKQLAKEGKLAITPEISRGIRLTGK